ncbi:ABC transporter permease [Haloarchaeobius sp. HME9146]|uniref:ABC transporter permease n=1 Tax=Haloarchaeobius sp. HME9146 TaxID=2978732 RepID=UPI0021BE54DE|nr:ABC transporter permease [Haloarchaeobius sp. HME9146]MCT9096021.1 ABC transporter permease [Haloarchaeobius sp. HME9146]
MSTETADASTTTTEERDGTASEVADLRDRIDTRRLGAGAAGTLAFLVLWQVVAMPLKPFILPTPVEVGGALYGQLTTDATYTLPFTSSDVSLPKLFVRLFQSLQHYLPGLVIGSTLGTTTGIAMGWFTLVDDALTPVTRILRPIPPLAWIAFAIIWFGTGHTGATFIVAIGAFWITFYNAYSGVEAVPQDLKEVAASLGVNDDLTMIRKVVVPSAMPEIFTGIRTSIGQCWMIVVAAELVGPPGVGEQILIAAQNLALDVSVAYMLVISAVFLVSDAAFRKVQQEVLAWRA